MTIHRLFSKDPNDEEENVTQNIYVFRFILFCIIVYSFEMLLNSVDIFIVDKTIFTRGYVTGCLFAAVYVLILLHSRYVHVKATVHIYVCTYSAFHYYGVCDANMVLLTTTSMNHLVENGTFLLNQVNENPGVTLALYYVLPRCLMAMSFVYVSNIVNQVIRKSLKNAMKMEEKAATDEMTGLYNKNKLLATIEKRTYDYQQVAIVYWDINRLKYVNDTYGHFAGDQMIVKVAQSIRIALGDAGMAFRYGGDEMLALIPGGTGETAEKMIKTWKQTLAAVQVDCEIPISAAVGYAIGEHEKLKNVIAEADRNMYACKHAGRNSTEK